MLQLRFVRFRQIDMRLAILLLLRPGLILQKAQVSCSRVPCGSHHRHVFAACFRTHRATEALQMLISTLTVLMSGWERADYRVLFSLQQTACMVGCNSKS